MVDMGDDGDVAEIHAVHSVKRYGPRGARDCGRYIVSFGREAIGRYHERYRLQHGHVRRGGGRRIERDRPQRAILDVLERDRQVSGCAVDRHVAEELQPVARGEVVALFLARSFLEYDLRPERAVERDRVQVPAWIGPETNSQNGAKS